MVDSNLVDMGLSILRIIEEEEPDQQEDGDVGMQSTDTQTIAPVVLAHQDSKENEAPETKIADNTEGDDENNNNNNNQKKPKKQICQCHGAPIPLIAYLCSRYRCTPRELQVHFNNVQRRREIIQHLRRCVQLRTNHVQPAYRNFPVQCNDLSTQSAADCHAFGGYLDIKVCLKIVYFFNFILQVRAYYYIKHKVRLHYPYMPCVIQYGGGEHRSFYPLEVLVVVSYNQE